MKRNLLEAFKRNWYFFKTGEGKRVFDLYNVPLPALGPSKTTKSVSGLLLFRVVKLGTPVNCVQWRRGQAQLTWEDHWEYLQMEVLIKNDLISSLRIILKGWQHDSAGEGTCHQAWWIEFDPWDPYEGRRESIPAGCPLISILHVAMWHPPPPEK